LSLGSSILSNQASSAKRVTIIGGSIAGLSAGLALLQRGWDVNIYEATHGDLEKRGAGVITHQALFDIFKQLDVTQKDNIGVFMQTRKTFARNGTVVGELELPQISTSWGRLYQLLKQQFPPNRYHRERLFADAVQNTQTVDAIFTDGSKVTSELLIAADGIRSTVRQQLEPNAKPEYVGYMAWRGLIDECNLSREELRDLFPYFTFCLPEGEQVLSYPIAGDQHQLEIGKRRCNVVWYRPAMRDSTLMDLLTDVDGNNNGESIAPDKVRPAVIEAMQADAMRLLSPQHAKLMMKLERPFIQPIYDLETESMNYNRVAIIGDAAFTARPHLGVGITKAAEDSIVLAEELSKHDDVPAALLSFNAKRHAVNHAWVNRSRELGAYLQAQLMSEAERQHAQKHRTIDAVMRETATLEY